MGIAKIAGRGEDSKFMQQDTSRTSHHASTPSGVSGGQTHNSGVGGMLLKNVFSACWCIIVSKRLNTTYMKDTHRGMKRGTSDHVAKSHDQGGADHEKTMLHIPEALQSSLQSATPVSAFLDQMAVGGRAPICVLIHQYTDDAPQNQKLRT